MPSLQVVGAVMLALRPRDVHFWESCWSFGVIRKYPWTRILKKRLSLSCAGETLLQIKGASLAVGKLYLK